SPQKLEVLIDELIKKRFEEGELDECPLTLKDLTKIKRAFLNVLVGMYHSRVKYPEQEKQEREADSLRRTMQAERTDAEDLQRLPQRETSEKRLTRTIKTIDNQ
ncbi:MAG TPA: hypothetical protein VNL69_00650, partial [Bacteroidota bacterium]|nr:hypothetical protein [Bacteroidota bacterium]